MSEYLRCKGRIEDGNGRVVLDIQSEHDLKAVRSYLAAHALNAPQGEAVGAANWLEAKASHYDNDAAKNEEAGWLSNAESLRRCAKDCRLAARCLRESGQVTDEQARKAESARARYDHAHCLLRGNKDHELNAMRAALQAALGEKP